MDLRRGQNRLASGDLAVDAVLTSLPLPDCASGADHPCDEVVLKPTAAGRYPVAAWLQPAADREGARRAMQQRLISGDNHIDLTYCPADLWSSQAPAKWKRLAPRVEERNDGQHWFVDDTDRGMWNGVGPGFLPYTKGAFDQ